MCLILYFRRNEFRIGNAKSRHYTLFMITFDLVLVFAVLLFILISLYWNIMGISFTFLIGVITLGIFGVLTPSEIINGFGNEQVAVVILMLLFSDVIRKTDIIELFIRQAVL